MKACSPNVNRKTKVSCWPLARALQLLMQNQRGVSQTIALVAPFLDFPYFLLVTHHHPYGPLLDLFHWPSSFLSLESISVYVVCRIKANLVLCPGRELQYLLNGQKMASLNWLNQTKLNWPPSFLFGWFRKQQPQVKAGKEQLEDSALPS